MKKNSFLFRFVVDNSWHFCFFKKLFGEIADCQNGSSRFTFFCDTVKFLGVADFAGKSGSFCYRLFPMWLSCHC